LGGCVPPVLCVFSPDEGFHALSFTLTLFPFPFLTIFAASGLRRLYAGLRLVQRVSAGGGAGHGVLVHLTQHLRVCALLALLFKPAAANSCHRAPNPPFSSTISFLSFAESANSFAAPHNAGGLVFPRYTLRRVVLSSE
jgi:hypothetical protein